ncbi:MAG: SURF1 family protein [Actinomycetota bacterium]|nr:SURF1 family protein [Actinomycetota bacterium]
MFRFLLKPKWLVFHLACLVAVVGMVELGFWQLRRLDERTSFNDRVSAHTHAPVTPLAELLPLSADDAEYRRAEATGRYEPGHEFLVVNVTQAGVTGRNVVSALRLPDDTLVIVNRGFVANGTPVPPAPEGTVTVVGRLKHSQRAVTGQPRDDGSQPLTEIRRVDLGALAQQFDAPVADVYLERLSSEPAEPDSVQAIPFPTLDSGPHLSYAVQWFIFTTCVIVGWVFAVRRHAREIGALPPKQRRGPPPIADEYR